MLFADAQPQRQRRIIVAREQPHARRLNRRDHQFRAPAGELPQRRRPLLLDLAVRRKIFKGQHIVRRQTQHLVGIQRARQLAGREHRSVQRLGCLVVGNQNQNRRVRACADCAARTKYGTYRARAVAVNPDTRLRPVPPARWRRARSKASECSRSAISSRTKGRIMQIPFYVLTKEYSVDPSDLAAPPGVGPPGTGCSAERQFS